MITRIFSIAVIVIIIALYYAIVYFSMQPNHITEKCNNQYYMSYLCNVFDYIGYIMKKFKCNVKNNVMYYFVI